MTVSDLIGIGSCVQNSLFGRGIYLSSELSVSLPYSSMGNGWGRSVVGSDLSCVALCEVIDHPDVKCQDKGTASSQSILKFSVQVTLQVSNLGKGKPGNMKQKKKMAK